MTIQANGSTIRYETVGTGKPVLLLHGFPVDHRIMTGCMEPVFQTLQGYRRIYIDLPGLGQSKAAPDLTSAEGMLHTLVAFIRAVLGGERFLLAGESYGGFMTLGLMTTEVAAQIDGALLLCPRIRYAMDPALTPQKPLLTADAALLAREQSDMFQGYLEYAVVATPATWARYRQDVQPGLDAADPAFLQRYDNGSYAPARLAQLDQLTFDRPVCFITGRQDQCVGYADAFPFVHRMPRATCAVLDGAGHNAQWERQPLFEALVRDWLARVQPAADGGSSH